MPDPIQNRLDPLRLGGDRLISGVRTADDLGHVRHRRILVERVLVHERIEAALRSVMSELHVLDVVRSGASFLRLGSDLIRRHVDELGLLVDELLDQPGTGDAIDSGMLTCDPLHVGPPHALGAGSIAELTRNLCQFLARAPAAIGPHQH